jgi:hypothetical protein
MDELGRLGRPGAYRLGELRAADAEPDGPRPYRPWFARPSRRGPVSAWVLAFAAGVAAVASGVVGGLFVAPFLVGLLAGLVMRWGGWRPRAMLIAATAMGAVGCGIPLAWQALHTRSPAAPGRVVADGLRVASFSAHGPRGVAVGLLADAAAALVAAGLGGVLAGRALARDRARAGDTGEPSGPADAGDLVRLLGAHVAPADRAPASPRGTG